jgi:hypothetical protein
MHRGLKPCILDTNRMNIQFIIEIRLGKCIPLKYIHFESSFLATLHTFSNLFFYEARSVSKVP